MAYTFSVSDMVTSNLPLNKRTTIHKAWLNALTNPVQRLNDLLYYYDNGKTYSTYSTGTTYSLGDRISGGLKYNNTIYEANNTNSGTFSLTYWDKVLPTFIGYEERLKYIDSRIVFEWALNKHFGTSFSQPNLADTSKSTIYISDTTAATRPFKIGVPSQGSSFITIDGSTELGQYTDPVWIGPDPIAYPGAHIAFVINISATAYNGFPGYTSSASASADSNVRSFADKINYAGMPYSISVY